MKLFNSVIKKNNDPLKGLDELAGAPASCLMALEPRIMFDGAVVATAADVALETTDQAEASAEAIDQAEVDFQELVKDYTPPLAGARKEVVFVDTAVANYQELLQGISPEARVIIIDSQSDGLAQMVEALKGYRDLDAVHIISHGDAASLQLGSATLTLDNLAEQAARVQALGQALSADGDIMLYGCEVAAGPDGREFVHQLAELTGADVAASVDLTGHESLRADWDLEAKTGSIETDVAVTGLIRDSWQGSLDTAELVSVDSGGSLADTGTWETPAASADGRYVVFASSATNLVVGDTNAQSDVFLHDRQTGATTRVSVATGGVQATGGGSSDPSISGDGRYVAFYSTATDLVTGDSNGQADIFVHDTQTNTTTRASVATGGIEATGGGSYNPAISGDGRYVAFYSTATDLVTGDTNVQADIFVHDTQTNTTTRASVATGGVEATGGSSYNPAISDDGRYVVFQSSATDLVTGDTNGSQDIFVRDTLNNITKRISVDSGGYEANGWSDQPSISADGRYVLFNSSATNLVPDDTNGQNDIFIHDTHTGQTDFASTLLAGGVTASGAVFGGGNDRYLLLTTGTSLVGADTNGLNDAYLIDRNDAPDLDNSGAPALNAIAEDPVSNPGTSSYDMYMVLGDIISDADHKDNKMGIAVTGVDNTNGSWQYSTNGGSTWSNFTGVSDSSATLLKGPEELEAFLGNGADLATGDLLINSIDLGPVTLSTALINGRNMQGAMNLANAINAISGATGVVAELEPLYYGATAIGGNTASENITFDLNGVNVSAFIASGATTADVAIAVANAIMTVGYQAKVHAWVGDGTNGGGVDTVVIESYASSIEITNLSELGTAKSGLANGTYTADATHNGGEVFLLPTAGDYVVTTSAGDDSILHLLGLGGGSSFTGIAGDVADDGTIAVASPDNYIRFVPNADYNGTATLTFRAWDQSDGFTNDTSGIDVSVNGGSTAYSTASESLSITVTPVNDAPVLTTSAVLNYTENDIATPIAPSITLADIDNANLESAAINISANYVEGEDVLSFTPVGGITGSWDAPSATLLLSGIDTLANYQAALASVSYVNLSNNPSELARTISFTANDGAATSAAATATVNVTAANDPPSITVTGTLNYIEDAVPQVIDGAIVVSDVDNLSLTGADIIISPGYVLGEDQLGFSNTANITGSWDSATGILTLTGTDTVANYQAALRSVTYQNLSDNPSTGSRTVSFQVNDGGASASSSATVNVTAVNDAPVLDNSGAPALMAVMEDDNNPIGDLLSNLVASIISDADNPTPLGIAVTGADTADGIWQFSLDNGATWTTFGPLADTSATLLETDAFTRIRFVPTADFDETATFTFRAWDKSDALAGGASGVDVSINGGSTAYSAAVETASISITGINDAPTVSGTAGLGVLYLTDTDNGGDLVGNLISGVVNDVDTGAFKGIAVTGYDTAVGAWQYSLDNGATWLDFGPVAETAATLLADTAKIRLVPNGHDLGSSVITFHGWDQTSGSNGMTGVDVTINGGTTAFSTGATTATATVQELIVPPPATTTTTITTETTSTTLLIDTTTATSTTEILTEATTTDVLITEAEINTDSTMETASTEEAVEEAAESEDDGETADEGEEQAEDEADEEGEAEEEGKEEEAPEIVAAAEGEVNGEAEVKAAAEAGGKSGKGLSGQLAKEKKTSEAERAEIIKIFDEVFDLLQCK